MNSIIKKNILLISTQYPPVQAISSERIYSFAKYLNREKFNVQVLTKQVREEIPAQKVLGDVEVFRVSDKAFFRRAEFDRKTNFLLHALKVSYNRAFDYFFTDAYYSWKKNSITAVIGLLKNKKIDVMLSSYAPLASHLVALELKKKFGHIKWIADFRDEMSKNPFLSYRMRKKLAYFESEILRYADAVTATSKPMLNDFRNLSVSERMMFAEVRNGYDFELKRTPSNKRKITIKYVGSFYGRISPSQFLKALECLVDEGMMEDISVEIIGVMKPVNVPTKLKKYIRIMGKVPHHEAVKHMQESDLLLLLHPGYGRKGIYAGKLFEYMASLKPILALVDKDGVAAELIRESRTGYIAANEDIEDIRTTIVKAINDIREGRALDPDTDVIKRHHRREQARILEKTIDALLEEDSPG